MMQDDPIYRTMPVLWEVRVNSLVVRLRTVLAVCAAAVLAVSALGDSSLGMAPLESVEVRGLDEWGAEPFDASDVRVRVLPVPNGHIAAEQDDEEALLLTIEELLAMDTRVDDSLQAVIADGVAGWMLRARGADVTPQGRPHYVLDEGVLIVTVPAPAPGIDEQGPFVIREVVVEGLSGEALTESEALGLGVPLARVEAGYIAPRAGLPVEVVTLRDFASGEAFYGSALAQGGRAIVAEFNARGYRGVRIEGQAPIDGVFRLIVTEGRVGEIRTSATIETREPLRDDPSYDRIKDGSPVQPGELINLDELDRYVYHLGRRPGRRVDLALSPGLAEDEVVLDLLIAENDPLLLYFQLSNTGTEETTEWRERLGLIHYNLTNHDDVLQVDFLTGNLDEVNALTASYERPFEDLGRTWWRVYGSALDYTSDEFGIQPQAFEGETYSAGLEIRRNLLQDKGLFADGLAGARFDHIRTKNNISGVIGEADFLIPYLGLRVEERSDRANFRAFLGLEWSVAGFAGTDGADVNALGRPLVDDDFFAARGSLDYSFFLEPLLDSKWSERENPTLAHELAVSVRGLSSLHNRLPPNYSMTAGGFFTVRGYPEAFAFGDNVLIGTLEYRYHIPRDLAPADPGDLFGDPFKWRPDQPLARPDWDLIVRGFVDVAQLQIEDKLSFEDDATLVGAGIGLEVSVQRNVNLRLDWGIALRSEESGGDEVDAGDSRLHALLTVFF